MIGTPQSMRRGLRRAGLMPMVRASRSQVEIDYLPPYGDPEVSIPGEIATYVALGVVSVELLDRFVDD